MRHLLPACSLLAVVAGAPAHAAVEPLAEGLRRCAKESEAAPRLACYDALLQSLPKVEADQFGMTPEIARQRAAATAVAPSPAAAAAPKSAPVPAPPPAPAAAQAVLPASIAELAQGRDGKWVITLDNGQVWIQAEARPGLRFTVGEHIQIEHGALGSLWLATERGRKIRVTRLR